MNEFIADLSVALHSAVSALVDAKVNLLSQANEQREALNAILSAMHQTHVNLVGVGAIAREAANQMQAVAQDAERLAGDVLAAIEDPISYCPEIPFEQVVGYCCGCGKAIDARTEWACVEDETYCEECANELRAKAERAALEAEAEAVEDVPTPVPVQETLDEQIEALA